MEVIRQHKGLVVIALLLIALVGVSALNSVNSETRANEDKPAAFTEASETKESDPETESASAETDQESEEEKASDTKNDNKEQANGDAESTSYDYTAQPGDTYSELARKAVQTYGIVNDVDLSLSQIIAAETKLTNEAKAPLLNEGEKVLLSQSDVEAAIDYAQNLSSEEKALWETYVPYVDFDTRDNGEK